MTDSLQIESIYTDGACSGNPGVGGWGVVVYFSDRSVWELGGREPQTTNNRMEMQAAIAALKFLQESGQTQPIALYTDSEYLKKGITEWVRGWKRKNWKTAAGKPVLNQDLWELLDTLNTPNVSWKYVRGHAGNEGNERCDAIARSFARGQLPNLKQPSLDRGDRPNLISATDNGVQSTSIVSSPLTSNFEMTEINPQLNDATLDPLTRDARITQLRHLVESLRIADEIADKRYLISSSELADLIDVNASAVTSRGDHWVWRNWVVSRVRREGNQILWQLERVEPTGESDL
jgi:ribonuclease HI